MNEANDSQVEKQAYAESAGGRLRHEREAQQISEKEAAHKLHLMVTDLRAIEADSYNASANDDQLRNYLRDYANLLTLNPDSILAIYDRQAGTSFHRGAHRIADIPKAQATSIGSLLTGGLVVATVVLGFLVVMQFTDQSKVDALLARNDSRSQTNAQLSAVPQTSDTAEATTTDEDFDLTAAATVEEDEAELTSVGISFASAEVATAQLTSAGEQIEQSNDKDSQTQAVVQPQASVDETNNQQDTGNEVTEVTAAYRNEDSAAVAATTTDELSFRFAKDCWVEVYDADEKRLIAEVRKAGESLQLSGKSPFKVLVGYSREVVLQFNDYPVDIEKIDRSYSTLFTVGRAKSNAAGPKVTTIRRQLPDNPAKTAAENTRAKG